MQFKGRAKDNLTTPNMRMNMVLNIFIKHSIVGMRTKKITVRLEKNYKSESRTVNVQGGGWTSMTTLKYNY